jgi:ribosomal-protein-alanine N-acetyltransferase
MAVMALSFDPEYGEAWTRRQVEDALLMGNCHYALIDGAGALPDPNVAAAGFSLSRYGFEEEELLLFAVAPPYRRKGFGMRMLTDLATAARKRGALRLLLEMRRGNPAETLYRAFGFHPIGERPNYYRTASGARIDAITFSCAIE